MQGSDQIQGQAFGSQGFQGWQSATHAALSNVFGPDSPLVHEFQGINYRFVPSEINLLTADPKFREMMDRSAFATGLQTARALLLTAILEVNQWLEALAPPTPPSRKVFVVHGHDEGLREAAARLLSRLDLNPIILQEQPVQGRTIIESIAAHSDVAFAVVLLTPDDVGAGIKDSDNLKKRARQNVILELGYFVGKLGRGHACALVKGDVELPSDWHGVLYVPVDEGGGWRYRLAQELRAAGLDVDLNKII
jgi:predicted nucleotide-binding protein